MLEASDFEVVSEQREGVGVEALATIRVGGITTRDLVRVVGWEPARHLAIEHRGWVSGTGNIYLTPVGERRTHVLWREELTAPLGVPGSVGLWLVKPLLSRIFRRDLRVLAALVRVRAHPPGS